VFIIRGAWASGELTVVLCQNFNEVVCKAVLVNFVLLIVDIYLVLQILFIIVCQTFSYRG